MIHVYPLNDEKPHVLTTDCECGPTVLWEHPKGQTLDEPIAVHHAWDCREVIEQAERIKDAL